MKAFYIENLFLFRCVSIRESRCFSMAAAVTWAAFGRLAFAMGVSWVIFACITVYNASQPVIQANITQDTPMAHANRPKAAQVTAAAIVKHSESPRFPTHLKISKFFHVKGFHVHIKKLEFLVKDCLSFLPQFVSLEQLHTFCFVSLSYKFKTKRRKFDLFQTLNISGA